jgi:cyclohexyl-isocyanide hydratase
MRDDSYAQSLQLLAEYAPDPPFNSGTPSTAPKESLALMTGMFTEFVAKAREAAQRTVNSQKP